MSADQPNVVYIFSDTHRWSSMDFTRTAECPTREMRDMKENGVSFTNCYSTLPICSPNRAMLMTGRWPFEQGFIANHMALEDRPDGAARGTLGWLFREAGYATHYVGKWHPGDPSYAPACGFDTATIWPREDHTDLRYLALGEGNPFGEVENNWLNDGRYTGAPATTVDGTTYPADPRLPYQITGETDQALIQIRRHVEDRKETPLFLMLSLQDPHDPWRKNGEPPFPENDRLRDRAFIADYHRSVLAVDRELGRVRSLLRELGIVDKTILVYSSDHGAMGGAQGVPGGRKRWPHDESSRVPFLVESPGVDHSPAVRGDSAAPDPESICVCHPSNMNNKSPACPVQRTVITKEWMYSVKGETRLGNREAWLGWDPAGSCEWCLYHRPSDPLQMRNLLAPDGCSSDLDIEAITAQLRAELRRWLSIAEEPFVGRWFERHPHVDHWRREHDRRGIAAAFSLDDALR